MKTLTSLRTGKEFLGYAKQHGCTVRNGKGSHFIVQTKKGFQAVVPVHPGDLGKGLRLKLVKWFLAVGMAALLLCAVMEYA